MLREKRDYMVGRGLQFALWIDVDKTIKGYELLLMSAIGGRTLLEHITWHAYRKPYYISKRKVKHSINCTVDFSCYCFDGLKKSLK